MGEREIPGVTCPHCKKGKAYRHERKDHTGFFWKCKECGTFFDDQNGKIGAEHTAVNIPEDHKAKCPKCGQIAVLYEKDGKSRWFCKHCKTNFFNNKDNTIGNEMQSFKK